MAYGAPSVLCAPAGAASHPPRSAAWPSRRRARLALRNTSERGVFLSAGARVSWSGACFGRPFFVSPRPVAASSARSACSIAAAAASASSAAAFATATSEPSDAFSRAAASASERESTPPRTPRAPFMISHPSCPHCRLRGITGGAVGGASLTLSGGLLQLRYPCDLPQHIRPRGACQIHTLSHTHRQREREREREREGGREGERA
jgi:hypothetical protein